MRYFKAICSKCGRKAELAETQHYVKCFACHIPMTMGADRSAWENTRMHEKDVAQCVMLLAEAHQREKEAIEQFGEVYQKYAGKIPPNEFKAVDQHQRSMKRKRQEAQEVLDESNALLAQTRADEDAAFKASTWPAVRLAQAEGAPPPAHAPTSRPAPTPAAITTTATTITTGPITITRTVPMPADATTVAPAPQPPREDHILAAVKRLRTHYRKYAADTTRIISARRFAKEVMDELNELISAHEKDS